MANYTITLTSTEKKSMEYITVDIGEWITNASTNRARKAKEEILDKLYKHCNENSITLAVGEAAQVTQAYDLNIVEKLT